MYGPCYTVTGSCTRVLSVLFHNTSKDDKARSVAGLNVQISHRNGRVGATPPVPPKSKAIASTPGAKPPRVKPKLSTLAPSASDTTTLG